MTTFDKWFFCEAYYTVVFLLFLSPLSCRPPRPATQLYPHEPDAGQLAGGLQAGLQLRAEAGVPHGGVHAPGAPAARQHHGPVTQAAGPRPARRLLPLPQGLRLHHQGQEQERHLRGVHAQDGGQADR